LKIQIKKHSPKLNVVTPCGVINKPFGVGDNIFIMENTEEIWKQVVGYEGHYEVSNLGNVRSLKWNKFTDIKLITTRNGYLSAGLWMNNINKIFMVHKLVAMAFLNHKPNKFDTLVIDHIDRNRLNNNISNLRLVSQRENCIKEPPKSGYLGVQYNGLNKKWHVRPRINKKTRHFAYFDCPKIAGQAYLIFTKMADNIDLSNMGLLETRQWIRDIRPAIIKEAENNIIGIYGDNN
tara:strand:+ start:358 stop:1062 length:705 start_codon:yes stop_codon:yes gene_type:complete